MTDDTNTTESRKALADVGDTPRPTVTLATSTPAAAPPTLGLKDNTGQPFDAERHCLDRNGNPMLSASGKWMGKRGNGARRLSGKPPSGVTSFLAPPKPAAPSTAPSADAPTSSAPPPPPTAGAAAEPVLDATIEAAPSLTEVDYEGTAIGLQRGCFALARLQFGPAWQEDNEERDAWRSCLRRLWCHYQLPRIGVIAELLLLLGSTIAKRREDARTLQGWARMKAWMGLMPKPIDAPPAADVEKKAA